MITKSFALIKSHASERRIHDLVDQLKANGCAVPPIHAAERLEFDVAECTVWWIARGGLRHLFQNYADVVTWSDEFYDEEAFPTAAMPTIMQA